jgi:hypothetical protein
MKNYLAILMIISLACNESGSSQHERNDTMPVIKPDTLDTSSVITTPPTGDNNVVKPDSSVISK